MNFEINSKEIDKFKKISNEEKDFRIQNLKNFNNIGFPNKKLEDWKFSDFKDIVDKNFNELYTENTTGNFKNLELLKNFDHNYIALVNGNLDSYNFDYENQSKIKIGNYKEENLQYKNSKNSLIYLNHALSTNGFSLEIESNYKFKKAVVIYNYFSENIKNKILNKKNRILVRENSEIHLIEYTINKSKFINNIYEQVLLEKNSTLKYIYIQKEKNEGYFHKFLKSTLYSNSKYGNFIFSSGLKFNKLDLEADLKGENSDFNLQAGLFLNENQHQEIKTRINHLAPNSKSFQKIKNIIGSNSKGVFQGKIYVKDIAQKTDAYQLSKALLLNDNSEFDSKPELEIYADDVKCSHGSTSGNIDEESLYYLMTRGLSRRESKKLLIHGFLEDVVDIIKSNSIKEFVKSKLEEQIHEY